MEEKDRELWTGGSWEHPETAFPPIPQVVIPEKPMLPRRRKPRRKRKFPWFAGLVVAIFAVALSLAALRGVLFSDPIPPEEPDTGSHHVNHSTEPPSIERAETGTGVTMTLREGGGTPLTYTQIYEKNAPSVVSIEAAGKDGYSTGTGIILTADGYILTNAHVVAGGEAVRVALYDNRFLEAKLVGFQADEDLAVLKVEAQGLTPAEFGDSSELRRGDPVAALGDPLGYRSTITNGIVSALDRSVEMDSGVMTLIQTSAAINFGNSGGALINQYGQVVGVTTIKIVTEDGSAEALGFAIPSRRVKYVVDRLIAGEPVELAVFGFTVKTSPDAGGGLELILVEENSDCAQKGLKPGDVVTAVNGIPVTSTEDLARVKLDLGPGDVLSVTYRRDGVEKTVDVALIPAPKSK